MMVEFIPELPIEETPVSAEIVAGWDLESGKCDKDAGKLAHTM